MAKKLITEKLTTTLKTDIECTLNTDALENDILIGELEEKGEKDLKEFFDRYNGQYVKITITNKTEKDLSEE